MRKLTQTKKKLASVEEPSKAELNTALTNLRIDLNYILVSLVNFG